MSNNYFTFSGLIQRLTTARASEVRAEFNSVQAGFDKLPAPISFAQRTIQHATATGGPFAYAVSLLPVPTSYVAGMTITFIASVTNSANPTLNVDGIGLRSIKYADGTNAIAGDITAGQPVTVTYNGSDFILQSVTNRVLNAVAQGIGSVGSITSLEATNLNDTTLVNGKYQVTAGAANRPSGFTFGTLDITRHSADSFTQILQDRTGLVLHRYNNGGTFTDWFTVLRAIDVTGANPVKLQIASQTLVEIDPPLDQKAGSMRFQRGWDGNNASRVHSGWIDYDVGTTPATVLDTTATGGSLTLYDPGVQLNAGSAGVGEFHISAWNGKIQIVHDLGFTASCKISWGGD